MSDKNQTTEEERVNQELIRIAELRIKEINASAHNTGKKAVLTTTASVACLIFFLTQPFAKAEFGPNINLILLSIQIFFIGVFFSAARRNYNAIYWTDIRLTGWEVLLNEHANSSASLIAMQKKILFQYERAIERAEKLHEKQSECLNKAVLFLLIWCTLAVIFMMFAVILETFAIEVIREKGAAVLRL